MALTRIIQLIIVFLVFCSICGEDLPYGCTSTGPLQTAIIQVDHEGYLYSPGYLQNNNYQNNVMCSYELQAPEGMHVRIRFNFFDIYGTDHLRISDIYKEGDEYSGSWMAEISGNQIPNDCVSSKHKMQLQFFSYNSVGGKGYSITYFPQNNSNLCLTEQKQCRNRKCVSNSVVCDGNDDCGDGTDEENCPGAVLPTVECGRPSIDPVDFAGFDRVDECREAAKGSWPWMADFQMKVMEPDGHICEGTLLNAQWVLTAAHYFGELSHPSDWRITFGNHGNSLKESDEQVRYPERIVIYADTPSEQSEEEGMFDMLNDIALVKLNAPVKFTNYVKPICLPDKQHKLSNASNCYATGWRENTEAESNNALKQTIVKDYFQTENMICTRSKELLSGICFKGDSGGPLVCETEKGKWSIFGVASFTLEDKDDDAIGICGIEGRSTVFHKTAVKIDWIRRMIDRYS